MKSTKIRVLLIDDRKNICDAFVNQYDGKEYEVHSNLSLEEAKARLEADFFSYHFVILDGLGHISAGRTEGQGDDGFAVAAIQVLKDLSNQFGRALPYCLYTAYYGDRILNALRQANPGLRIYQKSNSDEEAMWAYIQSCYKALPETTLRQRHPELFSIFDNELLSRDVERELIRFFLAVEEATPDQYKQVARQVRPIMEAVYYQLYNLSSKFINAKVRPGDEQSLRQAIKYLAGNPTWNRDQRCTQLQNEAFMPLHLYYMVDALQSATSRAAMHHSDTTISWYTLASYQEILADLLLWFKDITQKHA